MNGIGSKEVEANNNSHIVEVALSQAVSTLKTGDKHQIKQEEGIVNRYKAIDPDKYNVTDAEKGGVLGTFEASFPPPYSNDAPSKADFEQAITLVGYGKFHYILLGICGLVSTSEEMDVIILLPPQSQF